MPLTISPIVTVVFMVICFAVFAFFAHMILTPLKTTGQKRLFWVVFALMTAWVLIQSILASSNFYLNSFELPPRVLLALGPPLLIMIILFTIFNRIAYFERLSLKSLTHIQVFRLPLEVFVLSALAIAGYIPDVMTYYGRNFDVIVGITAPLVAYLYFNRQTINVKAMLAWNVISLLFLLNVTTHAVLSMPYSWIQDFADGQPNIAVFHFPYIWLPILLVQVAYFCHFASILKLVRYGDQREEIPKESARVEAS